MDEFQKVKQMIDNDTTLRSIASLRTGKTLELVMSDEFNSDGRDFSRGGGDDKFEAVQKPDESNQGLQFYNSSSDYVTTSDGSLRIMTKAVKTSWVEWNFDTQSPITRTKNYTSGR